MQSDGKKKLCMAGNLYICASFSGDFSPLVLVPFIYTVIFYPFNPNGGNECLKDIGELIDSLLKDNKDK